MDSPAVEIVLLAPPAGHFRVVADIPAAEIALPRPRAGRIQAVVVIPAAEIATLPPRAGRIRAVAITGEIAALTADPATMAGVITTALADTVATRLAATTLTAAITMADASGPVLTMVSGSAFHSDGATIPLTGVDTTMAGVIGSPRRATPAHTTVTNVGRTP